VPADSRWFGESSSAAGAQRAWGSRPGRLGPFTVIFGALAGGLLTLLAGSGPGWLLGLSVIIATAAGASAVRPTSTYLVIPVPALAYFVAAVIVGLIHDRGVDSSRAILLVNAVQWVANGFLWMCLSTIIAIAITAGRWLMTGQAGYRGGGLWLARMSGAWAAPDTTGTGTNAGAARTPAARPGTASPSGSAPSGPARSGTTQSGASGPDAARRDAARSDSARSGTARPEDARREDAGREDAPTDPLSANPSAIDGRNAEGTRPIPRDALDQRRSANG
jgi:hypothetical protein